MSKNLDAFTIRYVYERIGTEWGWSYEIRDSKRRFRGGGWTVGKKHHAESDAREAIAKLQAGVAA